jgi:hypothetical protein
MVCDIVPNAPSSDPHDLLHCGGELLFVAKHPFAGVELMALPDPIA